ncbi:MAG TPA: hypothetical protein VEB18_02115 [Candidatus Paceibacterota bacterium]|nr:hypothetical protein [Candidatus Paceibacterota bacterium]
MNLFGLGRARPKANALEVDFDQQVALPRGAERVLWHQPAGKGKMQLLPEHLEVHPMPPGVTYRGYREANPTATFGDALILDSFIAAVVKNGRIDKAAVRRVLGDFSGQIFFLGTAFEAMHMGSKPMCFAYLNWQTHYPALRYLCPADHPINHDVNCCALHVTLPAAIAA